MATPHVCHVDCKLEIDSRGRRSHVMYASEPSSAAGRYQWEQNARIKREGRRAWRATGQGQSRECRVWDEHRRTHPNDYLRVDRWDTSRRFARELRELTNA